MTPNEENEILRIRIHNDRIRMIEALGILTPLHEWASRPAEIDVSEEEIANYGRRIQECIRTLTIATEGARP